MSEILRRIHRVLQNRGFFSANSELDLCSARKLYDVRSQLQPKSSGFRCSLSPSGLEGQSRVVLRSVALKMEIADLSETMSNKSNATWRIIHEMEIRVYFGMIIACSVQWPQNESRA